ncbi:MULTISPECIES: hypothetical protein [unclassified Aurantimonas]|uniref:hypothetical protein n=1 Tax=unclassified Aurantimonas TaxID=2638230 RepID=UPI002E19F366|nr:MULTISPECIES: hypothetical protein [unclassified Aurantimonas]MEC5292951.1 hypothetical protein [Aurantimonas sp. C2-3-R2]MEC5413976.1 hypothetical protein [Aurantimonas sp. C2-4-R8]
MMDEISDPVRATPLRKALADLDRHEFQWQETYISTTVPGERYKGTFVGQASDSFMMMVGTRSIAVGFTADLDQVPRSGDPISFTATERGYNHGVAAAFDRLDRSDAERHPTLAAAHRALDRLDAEVAREFTPREEAFTEARQVGLQTIRDDLREGRTHGPDFASHAVEAVRGHGTGHSH